MHINFKYFIVSIGAIFLALGVGILIGTSMGSSVDIQEQNAAIVTDIDKQFKQLKEKDDKLTETNKNLLAKIDNIKDFIADNESLLFASSPYRRPDRLARYARPAGCDFLF